MSKHANHQSIKSKAVAKEPLLLVTPAYTEQDDFSRFSNHDDSPSWEQLKALGFIQHPDSAYQAALLLGENFAEFTHIDDICKSGFSNQINAILEPVSLGLGFTVLPAFAVEAFAKQNSIKSHPLKHPVSETIYLCTPRQPSLPKRVVSIMAKIEVWLTS
jgi:DNA-binding transcriptional LysR family regulator